MNVAELRELAVKLQGMLEKTMYRSYQRGAPFRCNGCEGVGYYAVKGRAKGVRYHDVNCDMRDAVSQPIPPLDEIGEWADTKYGITRADEEPQ